ncbi:MAG: CopD family protein [Desulfuromonadaceae bacterium]|nr:CopD family protein [Desulfuromonadaceae bacterium]
MKELLWVAFMWFHLTATIIWLGGIIFILLVAIPAAKQMLRGEAGGLMGEVTRRFTPMANLSILFLILSGIFLMAINGNISGEVLKGGHGTAMLLKLLLFMLMAGVHFFRGKVLAPRIAKTQSDGEKSRLQKLSLNLVWLNLGSGLVVLLLSAFVATR